MIYIFEATITVLHSGEDDVHDQKCFFIVHEEEENLETWPLLEDWLEQWYTRVEVFKSTIHKVNEEEIEALKAEYKARGYWIAQIR